MLELYHDLCRIFVLTMLELCRDARKNVCRDAHKKLCRDVKHILRSQLPVSDAGWSCEGTSVINGLSDVLVVPQRQGQIYPFEVRQTT